MKNSYIVLIFLFVFIACSQDKIPVLVKVEGLKMVKGGFKNKTSLFTLTISSDIDLVAYYKKKKAVNFYMFCPLVTNSFFANDRQIEPFKLLGFINDEENSTIKESRFYNKYSISFEDVNNKTIDDEKIKNLLKDKESVECMLVMPLYIVGPVEVSEKFCIQTKMVLETLK
jgi:hypothetical protein